MRRFTVVHLQQNQLEATLPLVRMSAPMLTLELWREFASSVFDRDGGILAALAGNSRPHGVAAFRPERSLGQGLSMWVDPIITFELVRAAPVRAALCQAIELLALARGCSSLIVFAGSRGYADPQSSRAGGWTDLGFQMKSVALVKSLIPVTPATIRTRSSRT